jgi:hypothetical protein
MEEPLKDFPATEDVMMKTPPSRLLLKVGNASFRSA